MARELYTYYIDLIANVAGFKSTTGRPDYPNNRCPTVQEENYTARDDKILLISIGQHDKSMYVLMSENSERKLMHSGPTIFSLNQPNITSCVSLLLEVATRSRKLLGN